MDIVVCSSPEDRARASAYVHGLALEGYRAWSDQDLKLGHPRREPTAARLEAAKAIIVLWTKDSVKHGATLAAANRALATRRLIPIVDDGLTALDLPRPHDDLHFARFRDIEPVRRALAGFGVRIVGSPWKPLVVTTLARLGEDLGGELLAGRFTRDRHWTFEACMSDAPSDLAFAGTRLTGITIKGDGRTRWRWCGADSPDKRPEWHFGWLLLQDLLHGLAAPAASTRQTGADSVSSTPVFKLMPVAKTG